MYDTWKILDKWYGTTWPSVGLPRGTPSLDNLGKIGMDFRGVEPMTSGLNDERLGRARLPARPWYELTIYV
jgi:hypothetical protein